MVGSRHAGDEVCRPAGAGDGGVEQSDGVGRHRLGVGVAIEDDGVAGRDPGDGVVDDGGRRVGGRGDGADHSERRGFGEGEPVVSRPGLGLEILRTRCLLDDQEVLLDLVFGPTETGFAVRHLGQLPGVLAHQAADGVDDSMTRVEALRPICVQRRRERRQPRHPPCREHRRPREAMGGDVCRCGARAGSPTLWRTRAMIAWMSLSLMVFIHLLPVQTAGSQARNFVRGQQSWSQAPAGAPSTFSRPRISSPTRLRRGSFGSGFRHRSPNCRRWP